MGGGAGAKIPSSGEFLRAAQHGAALTALVVSTRVLLCSQVVSLDPVIEDDAELQKYSKVC